MPSVDEKIVETYLDNKSFEYSPTSIQEEIKATKQLYELEPALFSEEMAFFSKFAFKIC